MVTMVTGNGRRRMLLGFVIETNNIRQPERKLA